MRLLILGFSSIADRRVLPAAAGVAAVAEIAIASKSRARPAAWPKMGRFFTDYDTALRESGADIVYLSLPNALHERWAVASLAAGKHVIIDKPALTSFEASARVVEQARRAGRLLAEATVYGYHPQFERLGAFLKETGPLTHVAAQFIIPPLPIGNFRNHAELGGGCLLDMGPYAASAMRILGGGAPTEITALGGGRHPETGVDMGFSVQARLANGGIFSGHFSFEGEYQNRLLMVGRSGSVTIERVFSPPPDYRVEWRQRIRNQESVATFEPADTFALFLEAACRAATDGDHGKLSRDLLDDAGCREQIVNALKGA
jgi:NDP-hexose-3-ketoreductase